MNTKRPIYFEKQESDRLCGLHCINSLLQGPFFTISDFSEMAMELDSNERKIISTRQSTNENVDLDGNYNIQVLSMALNRFNSVMTPFKASKIISFLEKGEKVEGLIFNSSTHWYSIRLINGEWFDLNSSNSQPKIISEFMLHAFIQGSEDVGYTNFIIMNLPPLPDEEFYIDLLKYQLLFSYDQLKGKAKGKVNEKVNEKEKKEESKFKGKGVMIGNEQVYNKNKGFDYDDEDMIEAMKISLDIYVNDLIKNLPYEPLPNDEFAYDITIRVEDYQLNRIFPSSSRIIDIKNFVKSKIRTFNDVELSEAFPKRVFYNDMSTIKDEGLSKRQVLNGRVLY